MNKDNRNIVKRWTKYVDRADDAYLATYGLLCDIKRELDKHDPLVAEAQLASDMANKLLASIIKKLGEIERPYRSGKN